MISLLNCMSKVTEKFVAQELSLYCEEHSKLHPGQMGSWEERWEEKKLAVALFMDIKGVFDHVSKEQLLT